MSGEDIKDREKSSTSCLAKVVVRSAAMRSPLPFSTMPIIPFHSPVSSVPYFPSSDRTTFAKKMPTFQLRVMSDVIVVAHKREYGTIGLVWSITEQSHMVDMTLEHWMQR